MSDFIIVADSAEQHVFTFTGLHHDSDKDYAPIHVPIIRQSLGRHPNSLGDYSLVGGIGRCHIERKSMEDAHSTFLGFNDGHRERFESELANLSKIESALVLVECSLDQLVKNAPQYGKKTPAQNAKTLFRSVLAWQNDYRTVQWEFAPDRRFAEQIAYWWLHRWWEKNLKPKGAEARRLNKAKKLLDSF
jgi:hypothetical protein